MKVLTFSRRLDPSISEATTSAGAAGVAGGSALTSSRSAKRHYVTEKQKQATLTRLLGVCPVMKRPRCVLRDVVRALTRKSRQCRVARFRASINEPLTSGLFALVEMHLMRGISEHNAVHQCIHLVQDATQAKFSGMTNILIFGTNHKYAIY